MKVDDALGLVMVNFKTEERFAVYGALIFDLEAVFDGRLESVESRQVGADAKDVIDVDSEKGFDRGSEAKIDARVIVAGSES